MALALESTIALANGVRMPVLGLGTYRSEEGGDVELAVESALELGYRHIDTASLYGNERAIGRTLAASGVPRDELFLATKVWNEEQGYESTLAAMNHSLERLDTDYVDLYLVHWPIPQLMEDTWRAMEQVLADGRARAIGVCNHLAHHLEQLWSLADVPPMVDQFEFHPRLQQPGLIAACRRLGVVVEPWAPIMRGRVNDIPQITEIAERHAKTPPQVALRWVLQRGFVTIPKSVHADRIRENADVFDFELSADEMRAIDALDADERIGRHPDTPPS